MSATLTLAPQGGLCNRMRAILGVAHACRHLPITLRIAWCRDAGCGAWFDELFCALPTTYGALRLVVERGRATDAVGRRRNGYWPQLWRWLHGISHHPATPTAEALQRALAKGGCHYLATGNAVCADYPTTLVPEWFRPQPALQERIARVTQAFTPHTYGLHIRRTDNAQAIASVSVERFLSVAECLLASHPEANFYLATDDAEVHRRFVACYGQHVLCQPFGVERHSLEGMAHAVVDLYALAHTCHVVGSYYSSYSDTAAELGHIPLTILTEQTDLEALLIS